MKTIKAYECPLCSYLTKSKEDFEAHAAVPADNLPEGLVFRYYKDYRVIYKTAFYKNHEAHHTCLEPDPDSSENPSDKDATFNCFPAKVLRSSFKHKDDPFLTPDEFDEFIEKYQKTLKALQDHYGIEEFVRTVPDIEIFVRDAEAARKLKELTKSIEGYTQIEGLVTIPDLEFQRRDIKLESNCDGDIYTVQSGPMVLTLKSLVEVYRHAPRNANAFSIGIPLSYDPEVRHQYLSEYNKANRIFQSSNFESSNLGYLLPILYFAKITTSSHSK